MNRKGDPEGETHGKAHPVKGTAGSASARKAPQPKAALNSPSEGPGEPVTGVRARVRSELNGLVVEGAKLVLALGDPKTIAEFKFNYQGWYTKALMAVRQLVLRIGALSLKSCIDRRRTQGASWTSPTTGSTTTSSACRGAVTLTLL